MTQDNIRTIVIGVVGTTATLFLTAFWQEAHSTPPVEDDIIAGLLIVLLIVAIIVTLTVWQSSRKRWDLVITKLDAHGEQLDEIKAGQGKSDMALASVMRSDLIHKAQKYVYEIEWATAEEKSSWAEEWKQYKGLGADGYIDGISARVFDLPEVPPRAAESEDRND